METIKNEIIDGKNVIYLVGQVNSSNAANVESEVNEAINAHNDIDDVIVDCENLRYISSSGLRIILRLAKTKPNTKIVNVSSEVYEVFEMTGFSEIIPIEKAYRKLNVDNCKIIGEGAKGIVYRYDDDTIIKYYKDPDSLPAIHRERELARKAFVLGVPTAIPYDVVKIGDSYGSVFELLDAKSLTDMIKDDSANYDKYIDEFVKLLKIIHETDVTTENMTDAKEKMIKTLANIKSILKEDSYNHIMRMIESVPESYKMIHGDFHTNNIMIQNGESLLIDMDTLSYGNPIFELYHVYTAYRGFSEFKPSMTEGFMHMKTEKCKQIWDDFLRKYFADKSEEQVEEIENKIRLLSYIRIANHYFRRGEMENSEGKQCIEFYLDKIYETEKSCKDFIL